MKKINLEEHCPDFYYLADHLSPPAAGGTAAAPGNPATKWRVSVNDRPGWWGSPGYAAPHFLLICLLCKQRSLRPAQPGNLGIAHGFY